MKKYIALIMVLMMLFGFTTIVQGDTRQFSDLDSSHWAYPYVQFMVDKGYVIGYDDGTFRPNDLFNRAAFAKLLTLSFGLEPQYEETYIFEDVNSNHWAYPYIIGGFSYLTYYEDGMDLYYYPDKPAVREEVAVAMVLAMGLDPADADLSYLNQFYDAYEISENLKPYVALAVEYGVMNGTGNNFDPQGLLTRAQGCTLFARYMTEIAGTEVTRGWYLVDKEFVVSPYDRSIRGEQEYVQDGVTTLVAFDAEGFEGSYTISAMWSYLDSIETEKQTDYLVTFEAPPSYLAPDQYVTIYLSHYYNDATPFLADDALITASYEKELTTSINGDIYFKNSSGAQTLRNDSDYMTSDLPLGTSNPGEKIFIKVDMGQDYGYIYTYEYKE